MTVPTQIHHNIIKGNKGFIDLLKYFTVFCCPVLYCTVVYSTVMCCPVLSFTNMYCYSLLLSCPVLNCPVLSCTFLYYPILFLTIHHYCTCTDLLCPYCPHIALNCPVLSCTVRYCLVLSYIVLYCLKWYCTLVLFFTMLSCPVLSCTFLYCPVLHFTYCIFTLYCPSLHCSAVFYCPILSSVWHVLSCTLPYCPVLHCARGLAAVFHILPSVEQNGSFLNSQILFLARRPSPVVYSMFWNCFEFQNLNYELKGTSLGI